MISQLVLGQIYLCEIFSPQRLQINFPFSFSRNSFNFAHLSEKHQDEILSGDNEIFQRKIQKYLILAINLNTDEVDFICHTLVRPEDVRSRESCKYLRKTIFTRWGSLSGLSVGLVGRMMDSRASRRVVPLALPSLPSTAHHLYRPMLVCNILSPCHPDMGTKGTAAWLQPTFLMKSETGMQTWLLKKIFSNCLKQQISLNFMVKSKMEACHSFNYNGYNKTITSQNCSANTLNTLLCFGSNWLSQLMYLSHFCSPPHVLSLETYGSNFSLLSVLLIPNVTSAQHHELSRVHLVLPSHDLEGGDHVPPHPPVLGNRFLISNF